MRDTRKQDKTVNIFYGLDLEITHSHYWYLLVIQALIQCESDCLGYRAGYLGYLGYIGLNLRSCLHSESRISDLNVVIFTDKITASRVFSEQSQNM